MDEHQEDAALTALSNDEHNAIKNAMVAWHDFEEAVATNVATNNVAQMLTAARMASLRIGTVTRLLTLATTLNPPTE